MARAYLMETPPARLERRFERGLREAAVASLAMAVPDQVIGNDVIAEGAGVTEQWIVHRTGVRERRHVREGQRLDALAAEAAGPALEEAGVDPAELDLVLVATLAADELTPNAAPSWRTSSARTAPAQWTWAPPARASCPRFRSAAAQVEGGRCEHALVIGADVLSRFIEPSDRGTAALFADGAGAVLVSPANGSGGRIGDVVLHCDGRGAAAICATRPRAASSGCRATTPSRRAVHRMSEATREAAERPACGSTRSTCSSTTRRTPASCRP